MKKANISRGQWMRSIFGVSMVWMGSTAAQAQSDFQPTVSNRVPEVITDYNGFWRSNSVTNPVFPNNRHHVVGFMYGNSWYSTGVNDALLIAEEIPFTSAQFRSFPFATIGGNHPGGGVYIAAGRDMDGDPTAARHTSFIIQNLTVKDALMDGIRGLDISTGVTNLANAVPLEYAFTIADLEVVTDAIPDFLFSQIGEVGATNVDKMELLNTEGEVVGNAVLIHFGSTPAIGRYNMDFFILQANQPYDTGRPVGSTPGGYDYRDIRLLGIQLSDFGITEGNYASVVGMRIHKGGTNDPAFYAFNESSIQVAEIPLITAHPQSQTTCTDGTASVTFSVEATGTDLTYEWRFNNTVIEGANQSTYTIEAVTQAHAGFYHAIVSNANGQSQSTHAFLNNRLLTTFTDQNTCQSTPLTLSAQPLSGDVTYQWYQTDSINNENPVAIDGATDSTWTFENAETGTHFYYLSVQDNSMNCSSFTSNIFKITVNPQPVAGTATAITSTTVCAGGSVTLQVAGHEGNIRWQYANEATPTTWVNATGTGSTTATYTAPNLTGNRLYRAQISRTGCSSVFTSPIEVSIEYANRWVSSGSSNWNASANWSCVAVPNEFQSVIIPAESAVVPSVPAVTLQDLTIETEQAVTFTGVVRLKGNLLVTGAVDASNLTIEFIGNGPHRITGDLVVGTLQKSGAGELTIDGNVMVNQAVELTDATLQVNGSLTFGSSANRTAVANLNGSAVILGNVTVEKYIADRAADRLLSSSVYAGSVYENWQENGGTETGYGTLITGETTDGFDSVPGSIPSLFYFDTTTNAFAAVTSTNTTNLTPGVGYKLFVNGDRTEIAVSTKLRTTGNLQQGQFTYTDLQTTPQAWSLIGNPFQNEMDMQAVMAQSTGLNPHYAWVWDEQLNNRGGYVIVDVANGVSNVLTSMASTVIAPNEAFFVRTETANPSLTLDPTYEAANSDDPAPASPSYFRATLFRASDLAGVDGFLINMGVGQNPAIDAMDAPKMDNPDESIAIVHGTEKFGIYTRDYPAEDERIPLSFERLQVEGYVLLFDLYDYTGPNIYLFDGETNQYMLLDENNSMYEFLNDSGDASARFELVFSNEPLGTQQWTQSGLRVYPNPVTEQAFTVRIPSGDVERVVVSNQLGQRMDVQVETLETGCFVKAKGVWPAGIYTLQVETDGKWSTTKLLVK